MQEKKKNKIIRFLLFFIIFLLWITISDSVYADGSTDSNNYGMDSYGFDFEIEEDGDFNMTSPYQYGTKDVLNSDVSRGIVWNALIGRYKVLIVGFVGIVSLTLIVFAMIGFLKVATGGENPQKKHDSIINLGLILLAGMLLGAGTLMFGYAYNVFR